MIKKIIGIALCSCLLSAAETRSIDSGFAKVELSNNTANILNFPFTVHTATSVGLDTDSFQIQAQGSSIIVVPTAAKTNEQVDLVVTSPDGYSFIINATTGGKERIFNLTTSKVQTQNAETAKFESGKIDADMKKLLKSAILEEPIGGYKKMEIGRQFHTKDLLMQKEYLLDGGKYRVEKWYLKNKTMDKLVLDEANFYTKGVLAIAFENPKIEPEGIVAMWMVINKSSFQDEKVASTKPNFGN